jgi:hypothetical protein
MGRGSMQRPATRGKGDGPTHALGTHQGGSSGGKCFLRVRFRNYQKCLSLNTKSVL